MDTPTPQPNTSNIPNTPTPSIQAKDLGQVVPFHQHNGSDAPQINPADLLGFPTTSATSALTAPTSTPQNGTINFLYDGTNYVQWVRINNTWQSTILTVPVMRFVDTNVYNAAPPGTLTDLDLSGTVGVGTHLVMLRAKVTGSFGGLTLYFITKGDTFGPFPAAGTNVVGPDSDAGGNSSVYTIIKTNASGVVRWVASATGTTVTLDVIAYI